MKNNGVISSSLGVPKGFNRSVQNYNKIFNHYNKKYKLEELIKCIIIILKLGISYININWNTIYI